MGDRLERILRKVSTKLFAPIATCLAVCLAACSGGTSATSATIPPSLYPTGLQLVLDHRHAPTNDTVQVFVCAVPFPTNDPLYGTLPLRLTLDPAAIATTLEHNLRPYYEALSHGLYHPRFITGATLTMTSDETHTECVEHAIDASEPAVSVVFVVATAEHLDTEPGGWGRPGTACAQDFCPATATRRAVYVGASDFYPDNGSVPLLDLMEHELGHTLDLPHSGDPAVDEHASALDVMSNSAAPRDVQPDRRNAQDTIAVNRLALGWLPATDIAVASRHRHVFELDPSTGEAGLRLLVLPVDNDSFLTVEYLTKTGFDDFLPTSGITANFIDQTPAACHRPATSTEPCTGIDRLQTTLGSPKPYTDLLHTPGSSWSLKGWTITVRSIGATAQVEVTATDG